MKFVLPLLLTVSMGANAIPIQWTTHGQGCEFDGVHLFTCLIGSFFFDSDTGIYSDIDLTFVWYPNYPSTDPVYVPANEFVAGNQSYLATADNLFATNFLLRMSKYDLTNPVAQQYQWGVSVKYFGFFGNFDATLTPDYEPPAVSIPATLPLFGLGLATLGYSRRKRKQYS